MRYEQHAKPFHILLIIFFMISATSSYGYNQRKQNITLVEHQSWHPANPNDSITTDTINKNTLEEQQRHLKDSLKSKRPTYLEESHSDIKIKLIENSLTIENVPNDAILEIYNIMGTKVFNQRIKAGTSQVILSVPRGYYIIKIDKFTRKIAIK